MLPKELDEEVARAHLAQLNVKLTELSTEQSQYLDIPVQGPYKASHHRLDKCTLSSYTDQFFIGTKRILPLVLHVLQPDTLLRLPPEPCHPEIWG